jgi:hypothetical protein
MWLPWGAEIYQPSFAGWETSQTLSPIEVAAAKEASIFGENK